MAIERHRQLPLAIGLPDSATFDNFEPGPNRALVHALSAGSEPYLYLWGRAGSGKTHLLQAACRAAGDGRAAYLPAGELGGLSPQVLEGMEGFPLLCLDDVDALAGRADWERALFDLFNRAREAGSRLLAAGSAAPGALGIALPDLVSRLSLGAGLSPPGAGRCAEAAGAAAAGPRPGAGAPRGGGALPAAARAARHAEPVRAARAPRRRLPGGAAAAHHPLRAQPA